jgi:hypothetical protein
MNLNPTADAVVGQNFPPEVFLGRANVTGTATAFFQDSTLISDFKNETQVSILGLSDDHERGKLAGCFDLLAQP